MSITGCFRKGSSGHQKHQPRVPSFRQWWEDADMRLLVFLLLTAMLAVLAGCSSEKPVYDNSEDGAGGADLNKAVIFKSQSCGCCSNYVSYMKRQNGFDVSTTNLEDLSSVKEKYGIPLSVQSCHTMIIGDYFVRSEERRV